MSSRPLIVLKFGGSVLRDEDTLRLAVHEIHRWRRENFRVVAVVSALAGVTDELLRACRRTSEYASDHVVASIASGGELQCASLLGQLLDRAGVPARVLTPAAIALVASGPALDAEPTSLNTAPIQNALDADEVVVVPGFVGLDQESRTVVFGRGGSDLTALFLGAKLRATRCRLVKDVGGIYERDPDGPGETPDRYAQLSWNDALRIDGSVVQRKAIRFARSQGLAYEVGGFNGTSPTLVDAGPTRLQPPPSERPPLRVALLGLGTVGGGVWELLRSLPTIFCVTGVLVRDPKRSRPAPLEPTLLTSEPSVAIEGAEVVVEALGGMTPAQDLIRAALDSGAHVVTANKAAVAAASGSLHGAATYRQVSLLHAAAVGGSTPILERISRESDGVASVRGVVNGTVNFVLDGLAAGHELASILKVAVARGFAEEDASRDLSGEDAVDKLLVTASVLGWDLERVEVERQAVNASTAKLAREAAAKGLRLRQVSSVVQRDGFITARVALEACTQDDPLHSVSGGANAAVVERFGGLCEIIRGEGAGRWPTAESVVGDLLELARDAEARALTHSETLEVTSAY